MIDPKLEVKYKDPWYTFLRFIGLSYHFPSSYQLEWTDELQWTLSRRDRSAWFRLTNRSFGDMDTEIGRFLEGDVNYWTGDLLSKIIEETIQRQGKARVLDLACGPLALIATGIAQKYGDAVEVSAVDVCVSPFYRHRPNLIVIQADARHLPFPDAQFDLVSSFQFFDWIPEAEKEATFQEHVRMLAPQGSAVTDLIGWGSPNWLWKYAYLERLASSWFDYEQKGIPNDIHNPPNLSLRRVEEFRNAPPGWVAFGRETPYLQVTRLDGS